MFNGRTGDTVFVVQKEKEVKSEKNGFLKLSCDNPTNSNGDIYCLRIFILNFFW